MDFAAFRTAMNTFRRQANEAAAEQKDTMRALEWLRQFYSVLNDEQRVMGAEVLIEWLRSDDGNQRFDALYLVEEFHVLRARGGLDELAKRLVSTTDPSAGFELEKVNRIRRRLSGESAT
jgi:hypothetical protein